MANGNWLDAEEWPIYREYKTPSGTYLGSSYLDLLPSGFGPIYSRMPAAGRGLLKRLLGYGDEDIRIGRISRRDLLSDLLGDVEDYWSGGGALFNVRRQAVRPGARGSEIAQEAAMGAINPRDADNLMEMVKEGAIPLSELIKHGELRKFREDRLKERLKEADKSQGDLKKKYPLGMSIIS